MPRLKHPEKRRMEILDVFIFISRRRRCGTQTVADANCVPEIVHFPFGVEDVWHTNSIFGGLCATNFSFFSVD